MLPFVCDVGTTVSETASPHWYQTAQLWVAAFASRVLSSHPNVFRKSIKAFESVSNLPTHIPALGCTGVGGDMWQVQWHANNSKKECC